MALAARCFLTALSASRRRRLIDDFSIALSPVLFGSEIRLFEGVDAGRVSLEPIRAEPSPRVTHLTYAVRGAVGTRDDIKGRTFRPDQGLAG